MEHFSPFKSLVTLSWFSESLSIPSRIFLFAVRMAAS